MEVPMAHLALPMAGAARRWIWLLAMLLGGLAGSAVADTVTGPPIIVSAATASGVQGQFFSYQIVATNSPTSFSATNLPDGLAVNTSTGVISGVPTTVGNTRITIGAANADGTTSGTLDVQVDASSTSGIPVITSAGSASVIVGQPFSYQITATNTPTAFGASNLPLGLTIDPATGVISGTPSAVGDTLIDLTASNAGGTGSSALVLHVIAAPAGIPVISSAATAAGSVGQPFTYQIVASNAPLSYSASPLPPGLALDPASGAITGTPTAAGTTAVTLGATNGFGTGAALLTITVAAPAMPVITSAGGASGTVGVPFAYAITATGSPTSFAATGLPAGLVLDPANGVISGTPTAAGTATVAISASNGAGTGSGTVTIGIQAAASGAPLITSPTTATATAGTPFRYAITATNTPTAFAATGLPAGLSVDTTTGVVSGTPTTAGVSAVVLGASNASGSSFTTMSLTTTAPGGTGGSGTDTSDNHSGCGLGGGVAALAGAAWWLATAWLAGGRRRRVG
jgi:hypothetical protein